MQCRAAATDDPRLPRPSPLLPVLVVGWLALGTGCERPMQTNFEEPALNTALVPAPQRLEMTGGSLILPAAPAIASERGEFTFWADWLRRELAALEFAGQAPAGPAASAGGGIRLRHDPALATEAYRIEIDVDVQLTAATPAGMGHAAHTLMQLAAANAAPDGAALPRMTIEDAPAFGWRGMHLDVSRHFFDANFVRRYIDLLALHKLNVLHWHLTDDQGWRIEILAYPRLTTVGATRSGTVVGHTHDAGAASDGVPHGGFYTQAEVREIVAYAAARGVTIVPEIDVPGHASAILAAYPEFGCGPPTGVKTHFGIFRQILCPLESTFEFLDAVFTEVAALFPGRYVHVGGDEVVADHWEQCAACAELMAREGIESLHGLQDYFVARTAAIVRRHGKEPVGWDEILNDAGDSPATVLAWRGVERGLLAARHGHDVIMSPVSHAYFDFYQSTSLDEPMSIHGLTTLATAYAFEPVPPSLAPELRRHVLGGQGALWTEYVATPAAAERQVLPRMSAFAEALWSPPEGRDFTAFVERLGTFLPYLEARGYTASDAHLKPELDVRRTDRGDFKLSIDVAAIHAAGAVVHYTLDGSTPGADAAAYRAPVELTGSAVVRARTRAADGRWYGDSRLTVLHHAGLDARLTGEGLDSEQATWAANVLLDGHLASDRIFHYGEWFGLEGGDIDLTLEWPEPRTVQRLSAGIDAGLHRRLVRPAAATAWVDTGDGAWRSVGTLDGEAIARGGARLEFRFGPVAARRLRLVLANPGPAWSEEREAEAPVTLRVDELVVE